MNGIKIISDGTSQGTIVLSALGEKLPGVTKIEIAPLEVGQLVQAQITFTLVSLEVIAEMVAK